MVSAHASTSTTHRQLIIGPVLAIVSGLYFLSFFLPFDYFNDDADDLILWSSDIGELRRSGIAHPMLWLGFGFFMYRKWLSAFVACLIALAFGLMEAHNICEQARAEEEFSILQSTGYWVWLACITVLMSMSMVNSWISWGTKTATDLTSATADPTSLKCNSCGKELFAQFVENGICTGCRKRMHPGQPPSATGSASAESKPTHANEENTGGASGTQSDLSR